MASWHTITVPDAPPKLATSLAGLSAGSYDGHVGIVRIGTYPDQHEEQFVWNATTAKWVGSREYVVLSALDAWAMDFSRSPLSLVRNKWARPSGGVGWQIVGPRAQITSDVTLPQATIPFNAGNDGFGNFDPSGQILLRDALVTYTSITYSAGLTVGTFNGCTNAGINDGRFFDAQHTPIIPFSANAGGDEGGWGTASITLDRVGDLWAAGFRLEERLDGNFNGTTDEKAVQFAPFYLNTDLGQDLGSATEYPSMFKSADQISNLIGPGVTVTGPAYDLGGYTQPGSHNAREERGFERRTTAWTPWAASAPTKRFLTPLIYAKHAIDTKSTGETYSLNLMLRWTGTPA